MINKNIKRIHFESFRSCVVWDLSSEREQISSFGLIICLRTESRLGMSIFHHGFFQRDNFWDSWIWKVFCSLRWKMYWCKNPGLTYQRARWNFLLRIGRLRISVKFLFLSKKVLFFSRNCRIIRYKALPHLRLNVTA